MILSDKQSLKPAIDSKEFLNYICYKHQKHNLLSLRDIVGDAGLVALLDKFGGTYIRFPTASHTLQAANDVVLSMLYEELKKAFATRNPTLWQEAETRFTKFAERQGMNYLQGKKKAKAIRKELEEANSWLANIKSWEARNQPKED